MQEADQKALEAIQEKQTELRKAMVVADSQLGTKKQFKKRSQLTLEELSELPSSTPVYKAVGVCCAAASCSCFHAFYLWLFLFIGKMFITAPLDTLKVELQQKIEKATADIASLQVIAYFSLVFL